MDWILNNNFLRSFLKKCRISILPVFIFIVPARSQNIPASDTAFFNTVDRWFKAWELVSKEIYGLKKFDAVEFIFFDESNIYSTSRISAAGGSIIAGPALLGRKLNWLKKNYTDSILLPDGKLVEAGLMSFASENKGNRPYFVMPLISIWRQAGVTSKELGLENLVTGVFLHEFSHSQQMKNFGKKIAAFETAYTFPTEFTDDIIQHVFGAGQLFRSYFQTETDLLYDAAEQKDEYSVKHGIANALDSMQVRQNYFFRDSLSHYKQIDRFFLTMEGLGQYSMYVWLTHPKGAAIDKKTAIAGVRRGKKQWSQEEGFGLFLALERLAPARSWASKMFGRQLVTVTTLIEKHIKNPG